MKNLKIDETSGSSSRTGSIGALIKPIHYRSSDCGRNALEINARIYTSILGLLHNLGDGCRHTATAVAAWRSPRRGEIFMTAISSPRRHSSPFGDTHRHLATPIAMATPIAIWRHPSPFGDRRRQGETNRIGL